MRFRQATSDDNPAAQPTIELGGITVPNVTEAWVTDNEEGENLLINLAEAINNEPADMAVFVDQRYWQDWPSLRYPDIFHEM